MHEEIPANQAQSPEPHAASVRAVRPCKGRRGLQAQNRSERSLVHSDPREKADGAEVRERRRAQDPVHAATNGGTPVRPEHQPRVQAVQRPLQSEQPQQRVDEIRPIRTLFK